MDRPIIFSAPMVRALLDGRKRMTRRLAWRRIDRGGKEGALIYTQWNKVKPGDQLWVREAGRSYFKRTPTSPGWIYRADCHEFTGDKLIHQIGATEIKWTPAIHMPRWASRITLTVTATKVERLNEISEEDAKAEGIGEPYLGDGDSPFIEQAVMVSRRMQFRNLWNELHGADAWGANPEVVALTFKVEERNIDAAASALTKESTTP